MSTTTIRLDDDLKVRIAAAAEREGKATHRFIVDAIVHAVEQSELDDELHRVAEGRWAKIRSTDTAVSFHEARAYLEARTRGQDTSRPAGRKLTR